MNVRLVTTWDVPCGIAEHSRYLVEALRVADPGIRVEVEQDLHPNALLDNPHRKPFDEPDVVVLNYHAALLSQWHPKHIEGVQSLNVPVVVIYHDTGVPNSDQCKALHAVADRFIVHEPAEDLAGAIYWRQGVPRPAAHPKRFYPRFDNDHDPEYTDDTIQRFFKDYDAQPVLGTVGFPFGWKNYDLLAKATAEAGWALLLIAPGATPEQIAEWTALNPHLLVVSEFLSASTVVAYLAGCDATATLYVCHNAGTSGAIRQCIAARKPVLASDPSVCRQFRDLVGEEAIRWLDDLSVVGVARELSGVPIMRVDSGIVALAERDSWARLGVKYARLLREVVR